MFFPNYLGESVSSLYFLCSEVYSENFSFPLPYQLVEPKVCVAVILQLTGAALICRSVYDCISVAQPEFC